MAHALVIGGTGMLADTSLWLVNKGYHVSIIGRSAYRMENLRNRTTKPSLLTPILVDYCDITLLKEKLEETIAHNGPIELVIAWIHSYADTTLENISSVISNWNSGKWKLFHVLGSKVNVSEVQEKLKLLDRTQYRQIQLGFMMEKGHSRWLTHEEISQGVVAAIQHDLPVHIVGTLQPWEKRLL
ncbi:short-chain dehydrogenase [Lysinibacillus fusiformis]|uniref:short-chain dehydrogenase n=1 Tax=Lysinibacillus fusiformis TaxID=28031 RepID=UPI001967BC3B|nr:short-chain dehydrogenase [Lysinibacillus fusiformis]QSB09612.1 short-chain dehydrogenase [Lysinibacillus fusiformis]